MTAGNAQRDGMGDADPRPGPVFAATVAGGLLCAFLLLLALVGLDTDKATSEAIKIAFLAAGFVLLLLWNRLPRAASGAVLVTLILFAALNYYGWGSRILMERLGTYDAIHYYLSAKYFDQLGYGGLYPAIILADAEAGPYNDRIETYRGEYGDGLARRPIAEGLEKGIAVKQRFAPADWERFRHDFLHLQRETGFSRGDWRTLLDDRAFNGSPGWLLLARPVAGLVPVEQLKFAAYIDVLLLSLAIAMVWRAFGALPAGWCVFFLCVSYTTRNYIPGTMFLRYEWVAALLVVLALLRRQRAATGGAVMALAAWCRVFPVLWIFGPLVRLAFAVAGHGNDAVNRRNGDLRFLAGFAAGATALLGLVLLASGGDTLAGFVSEIRTHASPGELSSRRIGLAIGYAFDGSWTPRNLTEAIRAEIAADAPERLLFAGIYLAAFAWLVRRLPTHEAFALGAIPFFLLSTYSYYYAVAQLTLVVVHASDLGKARNLFGLGCILLIELGSNWLQVAYPAYWLFRMGTMSWAMAIYSFGILIFLFLEQQQFRQLLSDRQGTA